MSYSEGMRVLRVDPENPAPATVREAAEALARGAIVAFPTDTVYGLAVDPRDDRAVDRIYAIKGRALDQPLPLIAADEDQAATQAGELSELARALAAAFWPGPLTLIVTAHPGLSARLHAGTGRVAVRVPAHATARALARAAGHPITATSANVSGGPPASTGEAVVAALDHSVDLLLDAGPTIGGPPSTIVDATGTTPRLVRAGVVPWDRVLRSVPCRPSTGAP
jgi:L-threonylcarbamoyladenylate synthase